MSKFAFKLVLFLLPLLAGWGALEHRLAALPNSYSAKRRLLDEVGPRARVAAFGSSHEVYGIAPQFLSCEGVNLANPSQSLFYDGQIVLHYDHDLPQLRLALFGISYFSFDYAVRDGERWRVPYYQYFLRLPPEPETPALDWTQWSLVGMYGPHEALRLALGPLPARAVAADPQRGWLAWGERGRPTDPVSAETGRERVTLHDSFRKPGRREENVVVLARALDRLHERGVRIAFVSTPLFSTYAEAMVPAQVDRVRAQVEALAARYDAPYHDYSRDTRFTLPDFHDNDHLNLGGAEKFSRILDAEVVLPSGACARD